MSNLSKNASQLKLLPIAILDANGDMERNQLQNHQLIQTLNQE
jgi:hypothetical protein